MLNKKHNKFNRNIISTVLSGMFLSGCAQVHTEDYKEIRKINDGVADDIDSYKSKSVAEINGGATFDDFFVRTTPVKTKVRDSVKLPEFLPEHIIVYSGSPMTEAELSRSLYNDYGIKVEYTRFIVEEEDDDDVVAVKAAPIVPAGASGVPTAGAPVNLNAAKEQGDKPLDQSTRDMLALFGNSEGNPPKDDDRIQKIDYDGSIVGFFDWLALERGLSWKYDEDFDVFVLYDLETVIFEVIDNTDSFTQESTTDTSGSSDVGSDGGTSSSTSSTSQKSVVKEEAEHWEDLQNMIRQMLSPHGQAAFDLKNGRIAITDTKQSIQKVGRIIDAINVSAGTQVVLNLTFVKISIEEESEIGVNISATDLVGGAVSGGMKTGTDMTGFSNVFNMSFNKAGVDAMIGSLGRLGSISYRYDAPILTMNNHLTPFQSVEEEHYVAEVESETDEDGNVTLTPKKEINKTGITSVWKNRVINDRVLVDGKISLIENLYMKQEPLLNNIVLPKNALDTHNIKALLRNGETRVVSIQEINRKVAESTGPFGADSFLLGGSEKTKDRREISVILVTPYIIR